jgi:hypothetical protein
MNNSVVIQHNLNSTWHKTTLFIEDHLTEMIHWTELNCRSKVQCFGVPGDNNVVEFVFESGEDAVLFALKWSGSSCNQ